MHGSFKKQQLGMLSQLSSSSARLRSRLSSRLQAEAADNICTRTGRLVLKKQVSGAPARPDVAANFLTCQDGLAGVRELGFARRSRSGSQAPRSVERAHESRLSGHDCQTFCLFSLKTPSLLFTSQRGCARSAQQQQQQQQSDVRPSRSPGCRVRESRRRQH